MTVPRVGAEAMAAVVAVVVAVVPVVAGTWAAAEGTKETAAAVTVASAATVERRTAAAAVLRAVSRGRGVVRGRGVAWERGKRRMSERLSLPGVIGKFRRQIGKKFRRSDISCGSGCGGRSHSPTDHATRPPAAPRARGIRRYCCRTLLVLGVEPGLDRQDSQLHPRIGTELGEQRGHRLLHRAG